MTQEQWTGSAGLLIIGLRCGDELQQVKPLVVAVILLENPLSTINRDRMPEGAMKRKIGQAVVSALITLGLMAWLVILYTSTPRLNLWCGTLSLASDQYLDGSGRMFQRGSWHLGNATRTWGETYGIKLNRFYVSFSITHINPLVSLKDAHEED